MSICPQCQVVIIPDDQRFELWGCCSFACLHDHRAAYEPQIASEGAESGEFVRTMPEIAGNPFGPRKGVI